MVTDVRERVLEHATELFHRGGFHATGVDRLASAAGISKKTLYQTFASKDDVLLAALEQARKMAVADLPDEHDEQTPRQRILAIFEAQRVYAGRPEFTGCFFVNVATEIRDPDHAAVRMAHLQKSELTKYVRRQAELGGAHDSEAFAEQITVLHIGAADYALLTGHYPRTISAAVEALLNAAGMP